MSEKLNFESSQVQKSSQGGAHKEQIIMGANIDIHEPVVSYEDIKLEMKQFAFEQAEIAFKLMYKGQKRYFKDVAEFIKKEFDNKFGGSFHVIVGKQFGSYVTYESKTLIQFWINHIGFLIFKFG